MDFQEQSRRYLGKTDLRAVDAEVAAEQAKPGYPPNHQPAMRVPKGGSTCSKCKFLKDDGDCGNKYYIAYYGSGELPFPPDEFCSDWFIAK